jgi:hypothetical protein
MEAVGAPLHASSTDQFAGGGVAGGDGEDPLDGVGVGRIALVLEPLTDRPGSEHAGCRDERGRVRRIDAGGEFVEELVVGAQEVGGASEQHRDVALGDIVEQGEHLVADPVAAEPWVVVARVLGDDQAELRAQRACLGTSQRQDRVASARPDCAETRRACAAQQREEQRFCLVVGRVAGHRVGAERYSTGGPCPGLEIRAGCHVDTDHAEAGTEMLGDRRGDVGVAVGGGPQAVVDVDGGDVTSRCDSERDQCSGVGAARETAGRRGARRRKRAPIQELGDEELGDVVQCDASVEDP